MYEIVVAVAFGLESVCAQELRQLGYEDIAVNNGMIIFKGSERDIVRCNLWLRTAERVLIKVAEFHATDWDTLFTRTRQIAWGDLLPPSARFPVIGRSIQSRLHSVPACQSMVKKAIVESLKRAHHIAHLPETGATYEIEVAIRQDNVMLTIDTTGPGLHKRGYRRFGGIAPLRESLAAGLVLLSRWEPSITLVDPLCGSGTIAIEAALIGNEVAPGAFRSFISEEWPQLPPRHWKAERDFARRQRYDNKIVIHASDKDQSMIQLATKTAARAGVSHLISFKQQSLETYRAPETSGYMITNAPYGERSGDEESAHTINKLLGNLFNRLKQWNFFILSGHPDFERDFGDSASKRRKLFNGKIKCYYYQYRNESAGAKDE